MAVLRSVAKTDTFEIFRQKVNQIASDVFSIGSGGSDLSTGNLRLGDGTRSEPSLAFVSDTSLGIYKSGIATLGFVSGGKKLSDYSPTAIYSFKDLIIQQRVLTTEGISVLNNGINYDAGTYSNIDLIGGTGDGATASITVTEYVGNFLSEGSGYNSGNYNDINLSGGSGSGAIVSFSVPGIQGEIINAGNGYLYDEEIFGFYSDVPLTGGSGTGAIASINISESGEVLSVSITNSGQGYLQDDILSVDNSDVGGQGSGFEFQITSSPGTVQDFQFSEKGIGYEINDVLTLPGEVTGIVTNLKGQVSGISTTLSDSSPIITVDDTTGIVAGMSVTQSFIDDIGFLDFDTTVLSVDNATQITLSKTPTTSGSATLNFTSPGNLTEISVSSTEGIFTGSLVTQTAGTGILAPDTTVSFVDISTNTVTLSQQPEQAGTATLSFAPPYGVPSEDFDFEITNIGEIENFSISEGGNGYSLLDILSINPSNLTQSITYSVINKSVVEVTFTNSLPSSTFSVGDILNIKDDPSENDLQIYKIKTSSGNITSILIDYNSFPLLEQGTILIKEDTTTPEYEIDTVSGLQYRYFINTGSGFELTPNITLYAGSNYIFDLSDSSNSAHPFNLSKFKGGIWGASLIEGITTTLSTSSNQIVVDDATGILPEMSVEVTQGTGSLVFGTTVESVNGNTITLSNAPLSSGSVTLRFRGVEYTDGVVKTGSSLTIQVTESTPNLYYYCTNHPNMGGEQNEEALITIDLNNPKVFGSGFLVSVAELQSTDVISGDIETGDFTAVKFIGQEAELDQASVTGTLTAPTITGNAITATSITSSGNLVLSALAVNAEGNFNVGSNVQVVSSNGNITTSGVLRTNGSLNINNILTITNNSIATSSGNNILLSPPTGRVAKVDATTALTIPAGTSAQRPAGGVVENGAIRFNTDTNQYEGYSATTTSWSSLGGVRDLDGNTFIEAEAFTGANDNTLYFYNDGNNTLRVDRNYLDFYSAKRIKSSNILAPSFTTWTANTPVTTGQYLKFRNNIYEVTTSGTTGGIQNPPTHTEGSATNGTAVLTYFTTAVDNLIFEEINELQIGPLGNLPLVINAELRLANNVISTDVEDLILRPNAGRKLTIDAQTSLVIPAGDSDNRGNPSQGSIRYNTTLSSFEGYSGTNWTSLGGVKDVDGNTYIIPETVPGANENILYFFNDGENTLQLSKTALNFQSISRITSTSDTLEINAELVSFDSFATSLDNSGISSFLSSTKDNFDFGLSVGLLNTHLLRLNTSGDIIINKGFGTAFETNIKVLDNELKDFELDDIRVSSSDIFLVKGSNNTGSSVIYSPIDACGAKLVISAHNTTTNDKEFVEYSICDKNSDIYNSEYGNITTGIDLFTSTFDFDNQGRVRINVELSNDVQTDEEVDITIVKTIIKK